MTRARASGSAKSEDQDQVLKPLTTAASQVPEARLLDPRTHTPDTQTTTASTEQNLGSQTHPHTHITETYHLQQHGATEKTDREKR